MLEKEDMVILNQTLIVRVFLPGKKTEHLTFTYLNKKSTYHYPAAILIEQIHVSYGSEQKRLMFCNRNYIIL